jgi:hypothetical protein
VLNFKKGRMLQEWWVWVDSNHRPHPYQGCALTKLSYRPVFQLKGILQPKLKR